MISEQEALNKACEMVRGYHIFETDIKKPKQSYPFYRVSIYHGDEEGNVFHDVIHVLKNGTVAQWDRRHLKEEL